MFYKLVHVCIQSTPLCLLVFLFSLPGETLLELKLLLLMYYKILNTLLSLIYPCSINSLNYHFLISIEIHTN